MALQQASSAPAPAGDTQFAAVKTSIICHLQGLSGTTTWWEADRRAGHERGHRDAGSPRSWRSTGTWSARQPACALVELRRHHGFNVNSPDRGYRPQRLPWASLSPLTGSSRPRHHGCCPDRPDSNESLATSTYRVPPRLTGSGSPSPCAVNLGRAVNPSPRVEESAPAKRSITAGNAQIVGACAPRSLVSAPAGARPPSARGK